MSNDDNLNINDILARKDQLIDSSKALRYSYNAKEKSIDVIANGSNVIPKKYNRLEITSTDHDITNVKYYADNVNQHSKITCEADVSGNLAGKYFTFYSGLDKQQFVVWYKVSNVGSAPVVAGATMIQVNILNNDYSGVVALATKNALELVTDYSFYYRIKFYDDIIEIFNKQGGITTDTVDIDTGFSFDVLEEGASELVGILDIEYTDDDITNITSYY